MSSQQYVKNRTCVWFILHVFLSFLVGCTQQRTLHFDIRFKPQFHGKALSCDQRNGHGLSLIDLRFYVHDIWLQRADGKKIKASIRQERPFQSHEIALLDFENAKGLCRDGNASMHTSVKISVPDAQYRAIQFQIGVPFRLNHQNPALANAPLTAGTMNWGWQAGYKFIRFEGQRGSQAYRFHLGSTGCQGTMTNIQSCIRPNRPQIALDHFYSDRSIIFDLDTWVDQPTLANIDCMSGMDEVTCQPFFQSLGLDLISGTPRDKHSIFHWSNHERE